MKKSRDFTNSSMYGKSLNHMDTETISSLHNCLGKICHLLLSNKFCNNIS